MNTENKMIPRDKLQHNPKYLLFWMQQSQRVHYNSALQTAIAESNRYGVPLLVVFIMLSDVPDANQRHYRFMIEGLCETANELRTQGIGMLILAGDPEALLGILIRDAVLVVTDYGYLRWQNELRMQIGWLCQRHDVGYQEIESDAIVPVEITSDKEEYSAATIRRKLCKHISEYQFQASSATPNHHFNWGVFNNPISSSSVICTNKLGCELESLWQRTGELLVMDRSVAIVTGFQGGYLAARKRLDHFIRHTLQHYSEERSNPGKDMQSNLSPYLHFGQISPQQIVELVLESGDLTWQDIPHLIINRKNLEGMERNIADYLEELIVRRELSINFCHYNPEYDCYLAIPLWARETLANHVFDQRKYQYCLDNLEQGNTHDIYWNRAQQEMVEHGKMHNYMRMYWGKKLIEWADNPEDAYITMVYLNNRYELDGRDPNAYAGIAWCFGKHDRAWQERAIFGKVRYMNADGLRRKFDMASYITR